MAKIKGIKRIRYTSPHPQDINQELLKVMAKYENICNYIHLPLQSGSDRILKLMRRSYDSLLFRQKVKTIQKYQMILKMNQKQRFFLNQIQNLIMM